MTERFQIVLKDANQNAAGTKGRLADAGPHQAGAADDRSIDVMGERLPKELRASNFTSKTQLEMRAIRGLTPPARQFC